jgi:hypothetical protein
MDDPFAVLVHVPLIEGPGGAEVFREDQRESSRKMLKAIVKLVQNDRELNIRIIGHIAKVHSECVVLDFAAVFNFKLTTRKARMNFDGGDELVESEDDSETAAHNQPSSQRREDPDCCPDLRLCAYSVLQSIDEMAIDQGDPEIQTQNGKPRPMVRYSQRAIVLDEI